MKNIDDFKKYLYLFIIFTTFQYYSCGNPSNLTQVQNYKIDYYTIGGITGRSDGLTIDSEGQLKFWNGINSINRNITDSLEIDNDDISTLSKLLEDPTIYNFKYQEKGNLTTVLNVTTDTGSNIISYLGTIIGPSFPHKIKELISELNKLKNNK